MSRLLICSFIAVAMGLMAGCGRSPEVQPGEAALSSFLGEGGAAAEGFARAGSPREFRFPMDHGAHPEYRAEWWYFTGNLATEQGRRFGYQLVLFRFALTPDPVERASRWAASQVYMAHLALTDVASEKFRFYERFARNAMGLAGVEASPFRIWLEDWRVSAENDESGVWSLQAAEGDMSISLALSPVKPVVLQGDKGLSRKGPEAGNASYYYSLTRMATNGAITVGDERFSVTGLSWLDREWSTSALNEAQAGWDWFSLQLSNGYDLMYYQLRRKDGSNEPFSSGTLVDPHGGSMPLRREDVSLEVMETWESPLGGHYPVAWRMKIPRAALEVEIRPLLRNQELDTSVRYWEGAMSVQGRHDGEAVSGYGYLEMTGYAR